MYLNGLRKMKRMLFDERRTFPIVLCLFVALLCEVSGDLLNSNKRCGQLFCKQFQYCSDHENHCKECKDICDLKSNNRQLDVCEKQCQDYMANTTPDPKLQQYYTIAVVALVVSCLTLLLFIGYVVSQHFFKNGLLQRLKKKKQMAEKFDVEATKNGLKLEMPNAQAQVPVPPRSVSPSHCPVTPATTSTPLSRPRHPAEDATLEYAYDNPALAPSPVLDKDVPQEVPTRKESSF